MLPLFNTCSQGGVRSGVLVGLGVEVGVGVGVEVGVGVGVGVFDICL